MQSRDYPEPHSCQYCQQLILDIFNNNSNEIERERLQQIEDGCVRLKRCTDYSSIDTTCFYLQLELSRHQFSHYIASGCTFFSILSRSAPEERPHPVEGNEELVLVARVNSTHINFRAFYASGCSQQDYSHKFSTYDTFDLVMLTEQGKLPYLRI